MRSRSPVRDCPRRRRLLAAVSMVMVAAAGCGASQSSATAPPAVPPGTGLSAAPPARSPGTGRATATRSAAAPSRPGSAAASTLSAGWTAVISGHGRVAVATRRAASDGAAVELVRLDAPSTRLVLHPGYQDPGGAGWSTHSAVRADERPSLLAAFNGGFKLDAGAGGMAVGTRQAGQLVDGLASVVTYTDGTSAIGAWHRDVPAAGKSLANVRQNLHLLVDAGQVATTADDVRVWGATLGGGQAVARSALGIDGNGNLIWAGSMSATPRAIADALTSVGVVRALELDINPFWVGAFAFPAEGQIPLLAGQQRPVGTYLQPWKRDFFTVDSR